MYYEFWPSSSHSVCSFLSFYWLRRDGGMCHGRLFGRLVSVFQVSEKVVEVEAIPRRNAKRTSGHSRPEPVSRSGRRSGKHPACSWLCLFLYLSLGYVKLVGRDVGIRLDIRGRVSRRKGGDDRYAFPRAHGLP
jgi:hypothetical protein